MSDVKLKQTRDLVTTKGAKLFDLVAKIVAPRPRVVRELPFRQRVLRLNDSIDRLVLAKAVADGATSVPEPVVPHSLRFGLKTRSWLELLEPELARAIGREPLTQKLLRAMSMSGLLEYLETEIEGASK